MKYAFLLCCLFLSACASQRTSAPLLWNELQASQALIVVTVRNPDVNVPLRAGSTPRNYSSADYNAGPRAHSDAQSLAKSYGLQTVSAWPIGLLGVHCIVYALPRETDMDELLARMRTDRRVESAQPMQSFATSAATPYSDTYAPLQRNLTTLHLPQAHRYVRGKGVRVAVIDTGVDSSHPDMQGRVLEQRNFVGDAKDATNERHGTAVAGIIAAIDNNDQGIVGVAPDSRVLALRACWPAAPNDARALCNTFTLAQALSAAIELRADVVNLSLSGPSDPLLTRLVNEGLNRGVLYVGAASQTVNSFPANVSGVMRVGSSAAGADANGLLAPGNEVVTLTPGGAYDFLSGSSLAAASVSGSVALLLSHRPKIKRNRIPAALLQSQSSPDQGINVCAALATLDSQVVCERE
jgi:subtilisin family serine protease